MNYTERLMKELERVTLRGNADKETVRMLAAIIFDMEQRVKALEAEIPKKQPAVEEVVKEEPKPKSNTRRVEPKTEEK